MDHLLTTINLINDPCQEYQNKMARKRPLFGANNYKKKTKRKRPGRISKRPNKNTKNYKRKKYRGQGK